MPKGYWIVRLDVTDPERFKVYGASVPLILEKFGARFLARAGQSTVPEGATRTRNTLIEFPSYQAALDCWHSAEYQAAIELRRAASDIDLVIVEGI